MVPSALKWPAVLTPGRLAWALVALVFVFYGYALWSDVVRLYDERLAGQTEQGAHEDYVTFYAAGRLVLDGRGDELYDIESIAEAEREAMGRPVGGTGVLAYFNPPFVAAAFAPLAALPVEVAALVIGAITLALIVACIVALDRLLQLETPAQRLLLVLGFLTLHSTVRVLLHGQLSMFLLLGWLLFVLGQQRGRERWSGVALALLLVKPQMAVLPLGWLLWQRRWGALQVFAAIAAPLVVVSVAASGPAVIVDYPRFLIDSTSWEAKWGVTPADMFGWSGFAARAAGFHSPAYYALWGALAAATLVVAGWIIAGPWQPERPRFLLAAGALSMASLLLNPHLFMQDLALMAVAIALGAAYAKRTAGGFGWWPAFALVVYVAQLYGLKLLDRPGVNVMTPLIAGLFVALVALYRRDAAVATPIGSADATPAELSRPASDRAAA
jgi:hypothetical protein